MITEKNSSNTYKPYLVIISGLIVLTFFISIISNAVISGYAIIASIIFIATSAFLLFSKIMKIKFDKSFRKIIVELIFIAIGIGVIITFMDYILRP